MFALTAILRSSGKTETIQPLIGLIKELDEIWVSSGTHPLSGIPAKNFLGIAIITAKNWNIRFEELRSFLVQNLGKERLKRLVNPADILENYGKECLSTWNELMKP